MEPSNPIPPIPPIPRPLLLSKDEMGRIHNWVCSYLPATYDRDFITDTIILNAWLKQVPHVSREYVRNKCISAWRSFSRERKRNETAASVGAIRGVNLITPRPTPQRSEHDEAEQKMLVEEATQAVLSPFERRLIWMRYYDSQTLEEISTNVKLRRDQVSKAIEVALYKMRVHLT